MSNTSSPGVANGQSCKVRGQHNCGRVSCVPEQQSNLPGPRDFQNQRCGAGKEKDGVTTRDESRRLTTFVRIVFRRELPDFLFPPSDFLDRLAGSSVRTAESVTARRAWCRGPDRLKYGHVNREADAGESVLGRDSNKKETGPPEFRCV